MKRNIHSNNQNGAALLALILIIVTGSAWMLLENLSATAIQNQRDEHDARTLASAKQALISYAVTHSDLTTSGTPPTPVEGEFGFLPCPDTFGGGAIDEGGSDGACGSRYENSLGRLPWRTLGLPPLKDSSATCLWYAVSGSYKYSGASSPEMLNADTNGSFEIYSSEQGSLIAGVNGTTGYEDRPVAVIFAPGEPVPGQNRAEISPVDTPECGGNYNAENYLESRDISIAGLVENYELNALNDIDDVASGVLGDGTIFNDKVVYITRDEIWTEMKRRNDFPDQSEPAQHNIFYDVDDVEPDEIRNLTYWLASCLAAYGNSSVNKSLPYPAPLNIDDDVTDGDYRDSSKYIELGDGYAASGLHLTDDVPLFGRLPDVLSYSASVTGKAANLVSTCDLPSGQVDDEREAKYRRMWHQWKDHFFYAVGDVFQPRPTIEWSPVQFCQPFGECLCNDGERCLRLVDKDGNYDSPDDMAAVVIFSGHALDGQTRYAPPIDVPDDGSDTKKDPRMYLDDTGSIAGVSVDNSANLINCINDGDEADHCDIVNIDPSVNQFNDIYYCLNDNDSSTYFEVSYCEIKN